MSTKSLLSVLLIFSASVIKAQPLPVFTHNADSVLQHLNKSYITTGILYDRVYPFARLHIFNTTYYDTTNVHHFLQGYYELYNAKYNNTGLTKPDALDKRIRAITKRGKVPIGIINFRFNRIDTNALVKNLLENRNGLYYDVVNRPGSAYFNKEVSIISALKDAAEGLQVTFETTPELFLQNTGHTITSLKADFNNGSGLINIGFNNNFVINYTSYGQKIIKFVIQYQDNSQVTTYAYLKIVKPRDLSANLLSTSCDKDDYITASIPFTDYENNTFKGQGNIHYYFATKTACNGKVKKPVIILDGFDPGDERSISQLYDTFLNNVNRYRFADSIRSKGYDIVVLNFPVYQNEFGEMVDGGADYIERNAFVLTELIKKLNKELKANGSNEKLVIVGPSMGGLISRYALAYMEKNKMQHNTRLWISLDAPHNGANVPIGVQKYVEFYANNGNKEATETLQKQLNNPAAKQQLLHHYLSYSELAMGAPVFRNKFITALADNGTPGSGGFPLTPRKIALADGSLNGALQPNSYACQLALNSKTYFTVDALFLFKVPLFKVSEANVYFAGSYGSSCTVLSASQLFKESVVANGYAPAASVSYDIAPGGSRSSLSTLANQAGGYSPFQFPFAGFGTSTFFNVYNGSHSFIPTKSALAYKGTNGNEAESVYDRNLVCTGETPFDTYFGGKVNLEHSFINADMASFAIDEITGRHRKPSYVTSLPSLYVSGPDKFCVPGGTYTIQGESVSAGTGFTWSVYPAIANISYDKNTPQQVQLSKISSGTATLSLALNRRCGLKQTLTKTFSIGGYSSGDYSINGPSSSCPNQIVNFSTNQLPGATNYSWFYSGDWAYVSGQGTSSLSLRTGTTSGQVGVRVANACDAGGSPAIKYVSVTNCSFVIAASPNPAYNNVTVTTQQPQQVKLLSKEQDKIYKIEVINQFGNIIKKFSYQNGVTSTKINLNTLVNGTYVIHAFNGKVWGYKQVIVVH